MALKEEFERQGTWLFRYRGSLPLIILLIGFFLIVEKQYYPEKIFNINLNYTYIYEICCFLISVFGLFIRFITVGYTPKNTSGRNVKKQVADTLNSKGIYSIVRHPLYLGNFFCG